MEVIAMGTGARSGATGAGDSDLTGEDISMQDLSVEENDPEEVYDELGSMRFRDVMDESVEYGDTLASPESELETGDDKGPETLTERVLAGYLEVRNTVMKPAYLLGYSSVDQEAPEEELKEVEESNWRPSLIHYSPLIAGAGLAAAELAMGDADLALATGEITAGYAGKWAFTNSHVASQAGKTTAARDAITEERAEELQEEGYSIVPLPDDTIEEVEDREDIEEITEALD
ncbi:MAG: hypothetical protein MUP63_02695 [Candidatus Nanohaloarchaeota archaeon QJJ-7]|nr:hypothetical protein [Candidatus Nanohaloarchaeota archaeon QJJ-7]